MVEIILFVLGLVIGGVISWSISWRFARESSQELRAEAATLRAETVLVRQTVNALGDALEQEGWVRLHRDAQGNIDGLWLIRGTINAQLPPLTAYGAGTVAPPVPRPDAPVEPRE